MKHESRTEFPLLFRLFRRILPWVIGVGIFACLATRELRATTFSVDVAPSGDRRLKQGRRSTDEDESTTRCCAGATPAQVRRGRKLVRHRHAKFRGALQPRNEDHLFHHWSRCRRFTQCQHFHDLSRYLQPTGETSGHLRGSRCGEEAI